MKYVALAHLACFFPSILVHVEGFVAPSSSWRSTSAAKPPSRHAAMQISDAESGFSSTRFKPTGQTTFDKMRSFESRLETIELGAPSALANFYEPHLKSFSVKPGSVQGISITSTCYALQTLLSSSDSSLYDSVAIMDMSSFMEEEDGVVESRVPVRAVVRALLMAEWRDDDLFQVPLLLHTVLSVDKERSLLGSGSMDEVLAAKVRKLVEAVLSARPQRRFGSNQPYSDYIQFLCCQSFASLYDATAIPTAPGLGEETKVTIEKESGVGGLPNSALPDGAASQLSLSLARCAEVSFNELCRQLAYRSAGDVTSFDVIRLAYSLLGYITASNSLAGTAGRELVPGEGPSPGTKIGPPNRRLVVAALAAFFAEQNNDGMWEKGQPIYKSFRRSGRNVGNAFVFVTDTLGCLMEKLPPEDFRPHLDALQNTLKWIESHQIVEVIPDYCDPESGQCYGGKTLRGWASPHLTQDVGPLSWSTAQTLTCVSRLRKVVRALQHSDVLAEFKGVPQSENGPKLAAWDRLLDTDLGSCEGAERRTLKDVLEKRVIRPFSVSVNSPTYGAAYSAILFGPPGTAKTTICEALAKRLGWDFLVIDTAVFLADGLTNVASRIRYVFERLQALEQCVILFDEIEEFCLDREKQAGMESRMLTTAMLTAINDLRRAKRSIFFLATNRLRAFDAAITRAGRFDMQCFVGAPNLEARCIQLRQKLVGVAVSEERKQKAEATYRSFLESVWTEDAMFMNYLEGMQYATVCANIVASGAELTNKELASILKTQAAVMTARGAVRDEYLASMEMSRL